MISLYQFNRCAPDFYRIFKMPLKLFSAIHGFDILKFDEALSKKDHEYDCVECTYKGKPTCMRDYILVKYGEEAATIIERLLSWL
jgi:hypothetical protein